MKSRIFSCILACLLTLTLLTGCAQTADPDPVGPTPTTTQEAPTTTAAEAPTTTAAPVTDTAKYNRLTGEYDCDAGANARAVGVMVGNNDRSRPQIGLANADAYVEAETEGGITRMLAIFSDPSRVPAQLCPIRSARSPFVLMAQALDIVYVHAGGSVAGLQTLANVGIDSVNALGNNGSTFWRDEAMRSARGTEYSLSTGGSNLKNCIASHGIRSTSDRAPFTFGDTVTGTDCTELQVVFSGSQTDCFVYNADSGLYKKYVGKLGSASVHVTTDGSPIEVRNVVVMYDTKYAENDTTINFNLKSGAGLFFAGGKMQEIAWSRSASGLSFTKDGAPVTFLPGKTYICLVNKANAGSTITR